MIATRMLFTIAVLTTTACGGRVLGESAPNDITPDPGEAPRASAFADPFHPGQSWIGTYTCAQGLTDLDFKIVAAHDDVIDDAIFVFDWKSGGVIGSYHLSGTFDTSTGVATFTPGEWIDQPDGWVSVGLHGPASDAGFSGDITNGSCTTFSVEKS
ncbi:MAG: hypothetical protein ABI183_10815 [Polyangiaceae bacterium]